MVTRNLIKNILMALLTLSLLFVVVEIYFSIKFREELKDQFSPLIYMPDTVTGYRYIPNSEDEISKPGIGRKKVKINSLGFFSPEFTAHKKTGTYRIIIVGASAASGIWMNGKENFSVKLQRLFNNSNKKNIEVINCTLDGQGLGEGLLATIKEKLVNFEPDLILMELPIPVSTGSMYRESYKGYLLQYYTDSTRTLGKQAIDEVESKWFFNFCYDHFYTVRAWCRNYIQENKSTRQSMLMSTYRDKISRTEMIDLSYYNFNRSVQLMKETNDTVVNRTNGKLVYFSYGAEKNGIGAYLKQMGLNTIFLQCKFEDKHLSLPDSHFNESGHAMIADSLYSRLLTFF